MYHPNPKGGTRRISRGKLRTETYPYCPRNLYRILYLYSFALDTPSTRERERERERRSIPLKITGIGCVRVPSLRNRATSNHILRWNVATKLYSPWLAPRISPNFSNSDTSLFSSPGIVEGQPIRIRNQVSSSSKGVVQRSCSL